MHEWLQKVNTVEELPESLQTVVRMPKRTLIILNRKKKMLK